VNADAPATMLELDGDDAALAGRLGQALRRAFAQRGLDDGRRESLAELRLAMGCAEDEPECLARGGRTLGVKTLTYGNLRRSKDGYVLDMTMLAVDSAKVTSSVRLTLSAAELGSGSIDRTAERVVADLLDEEVVPAPVEPPPVPPATPAPTATSPATAPVDAPVPGPREGGKGKIWWGLEKPTPTWKWALLGTSIALVVGSTISVIATNVATTRKRDELIDTANASLVDTYGPGHPMEGELNRMNDVNPMEVDDICAAAREHPPEDTMNQDSVRNKSVVEVCNSGDALEKGVYASYGLLGVSLLSTLVFTGVLLIHRKKGPAAHATARHRVRMSFSPSLRGFGAAVTGRF
jgi:hypothetical protein